MPKMISVTAAGMPEPGVPAPDRVLAGTPHNRTWNAYETPDGRFFSGIWESDPGKWRIEYTEAEFCHILSGVSRIAGDDGSAREVRAGDAFVIPPGFAGTWEVIETTRKHYAIYLPEGA